MKAGIKRFLFSLLTLGLLAGASYAQDIENGKVVYVKQCATCHGEYGEVSNDVIPNILGQYPGYMLTQMAAFLSDDPKSARAGIAGSLKRSILSEITVEEIQDIVAYLGTIKYTVSGASEEEAKARGELSSNGWWLANFAGCGNCHGDDQMGLRVRSPATGEIDADVGAPFTPKLVGLKGGYIKRQLEAYAAGRRAGGMSAMKHIMAPLFLTPRLIQAVGDYAEGVDIVPVVDGSSDGEQQ